MPTTTGQVRGIAVSWKTDEVFWTDETAGSIHKMSLSGSGISIILTDLVQAPIGIAVDMDNRYIFVTLTELVIYVNAPSLSICMNNI